MKQDIEDILLADAIDASNRHFYTGYVNLLNAHRCLLTGKIPLDPIILAADGGLYERDALVNIINEADGDFESPLTGKMVHITMENVRENPATLFIKSVLDSHFKSMSEFKVLRKLRHADIIDKLLEELCTSLQPDEEELEMRANNIKKLIKKNSSILKVNDGNYFGIQTNNFLELICRFPEVPHSHFNNLCITPSLFFAATDALKEIILNTHGSHKTLFDLLCYTMLTETHSSILAQCLRNRLNDVIEKNYTLQSSKFSTLLACGADLLSPTSSGTSLLYKALKLDRNDIVEVILTQEILPLHMFQQTFNMAIEKVNLNKSTEVITKLYQSRGALDRSNPFNMCLALSKAISLYLEYEGSRKGQAFRRRINLLINLMDKAEKESILSLPITISSVNKPAAWHAIQSRSVWLLECLLYHGAKYYSDLAISETPLYRAIQKADNMKLQLMLNIIAASREGKLTAGNLFCEKIETALLSVASKIQDTTARNIVVRTLFSAGFGFHKQAFSSRKDRDHFKQCFDEVQHDIKNNIKRHVDIEQDRFDPIWARLDESALDEINPRFSNGFFHHNNVAAHLRDEDYGIHLAPHNHENNNNY